ncbi:hypothetical protein ABZP36_031747 [Zizania latifolia]
MAATGSYQTHARTSVSSELPSPAAAPKLSPFTTFLPVGGRHDAIRLVFLLPLHRRHPNSDVPCNSF